MKKVYVSPEFELLKLRLYADVLTSSTESQWASEGGDDVDDWGIVDPFHP